MNTDIIPILGKITFDAFWTAYPRKAGGKARAEKSFLKLSEADQYNAIMGAKHHLKNNPQWRDPSLIPHAATFLNQARWLDEIAEVKDAKERVTEASNESPAHTVWYAMTQMYGEQWIKRYGEHPTELWRKMLKDMPVERLKRGLRGALEAHGDFPPSLPKFIEYCSIRFDEQHPTALPKPRPDPAKALESLKKIKHILGVD